ncbi:MAG: hypothetical protein H6766_04060 [Candidatus Peribacteria bacterium]|nr:MAG: hypothetical protein H6766_04060 [Candidatus Peribacteria bacterium]
MFCTLYMYNPNDITLNPNSTTTPPHQPQPQNEHDTTAVPTVHAPVSDESFDVDRALAAIEESTPSPDPLIKVNPRNADAVIENHQEDVRNGLVSDDTPVPPMVQPSVPHAPVAQPLPTQQIPSTLPTTPTIPTTSNTPDSPAKQAVHQAFGVAGAVTAATAATSSATPTVPTIPVVPATPTTTTPRVINTKKSGKRISFIGFTIGCGIFLLLLLGGGALVLWSMFQDPNQAWTIIDRASGELLIKLFTGTIFGILTIFGVFFLFVNLFRLASKKNTRKISYIGGMLVGFLMLGA